MATTDVLKGLDAKVYLDGNLIAYGQSYDHSLDAELAETTSWSGTQPVKTFVKTLHSGKISFKGFYMRGANPGEVSSVDIKDALVLGTEVVLKWGDTTTTGEIHYTAKALVASVGESNPGPDGLVEFTAEFQLNETPQKVTNP